MILAHGVDLWIGGVGWLVGVLERAWGTWILGMAEVVLVFFGGQKRGHGRGVVD